MTGVLIQKRNVDKSHTHRINFPRISDSQSIVATVAFTCIASLLIPVLLQSGPRPLDVICIQGGSFSVTVPHDSYLCKHLDNHAQKHTLLMS